jgi:hypothetical protein
MVLAALLLLLQGKPAKSDLEETLSYLERHQSEDGSWGRRVGGCRCPEEPGPLPVPDQAVRTKVAALIRALGDDDRERRDEAQRALRDWGDVAVPQLQESALQGDAEIRTRCLALIRTLGDSRSAADLECSALALLALTGAGDGPRSAVLDGVDGGLVMTRGQAWLLGRREAGGSFGTTSAATQAIVTLALCERIALTDQRELRDPLQEAVDFVAAHPASDGRGLFYQVLALKAAEIAQFRIPKDALQQRIPALGLKRAGEPWSIFLRSASLAAAIFAYRDRTSLDYSGIPGLDPLRMEPETVYAVSLALFQKDLPGGAAWTAWKEKRDAALLPERRGDRCERGSWKADGTAARVKSAAYGALSREFTYVYSLPQGPK